MMYYNGVRNRHDPTVFQESNPEFANVCLRLEIFFGREIICFHSSREDIWCVVAFIGVLIYFGLYYHIYDPDCPLFLDFYFIDPTPLFVFTVLLFMLCF